VKPQVTSLAVIDHHPYRGERFAACASAAAGGVSHSEIAVRTDTIFVSVWLRDHEVDGAVDPKAAFASLLTTEVKPWLQERGFDRSGNTFRRMNEYGDVAVVEFQRSQSSDERDVYFYINLGASPRAWLAWLDAASPGRRPDATGALWRQRVSGPAAAQFEVGQRRNVQDAGAYVLQRLSEEVPPLLELLDRDVFLARTRQLHTSVLARVVLTLDRGDAAAVEAAVEPLTRNPALASAFDRRFADWARQYGRRL
jgi:hypothetical protein